MPVPTTMALSKLATAPAARRPVLFIQTTNLRKNETEDDVVLDSSETFVAKIDPLPQAEFTGAHTPAAQALYDRAVRDLAWLNAWKEEEEMKRMQHERPCTPLSTFAHYERDPRMIWEMQGEPGEDPEHFEFYILGRPANLSTDVLPGSPKSIASPVAIAPRLDLGEAFLPGYDVDQEVDEEEGWEDCPEITDRLLAEIKAEDSYTERAENKDAKLVDGYIPSKPKGPSIVRRAWWRVLKHVGAVRIGSERYNGQTPKAWPEDDRVPGCCAFA